MPRFFKRKKPMSEEPQEATKQDDKPIQPEAKSASEVSENKPEVSKVCAECEGTGLELPEGNKKFVSQATKICKPCEGSGKVK